MNGQLNISEYLKSLSMPKSGGCAGCICKNCLWNQSGRCPHGNCFDDKRAVDNPYDKIHPDEPPRTTWSNWKTDQAYWCRGGIFYLAHRCEHFVKFTGVEIKECIKGMIGVFQDGYVDCGLVNSIGCETCYKELEDKMNRLEENNGTKRDSKN